MAEKTSKPSSPDPFETIVVIIFVSLLVSAILTRFDAFIGVIKDSFESGVIGNYFSVHILPTLKLISFVISSVAIFGIAKNIFSLNKISAEQNSIYNTPPATKANGEIKENRRWKRILEHMNTDNPSEWKLAILEADIVLNELLDVMGYRGETVSDKLKIVEKSDFETIESAWEAHKVRNVIAHEGADFVITEREARRVIGLYRSVFEEFKFI